jgi:hypothetical protein
MGLRGIYHRAHLAIQYATKHALQAASGKAQFGRQQCRPLPMPDLRRRGNRQGLITSASN